MGLHNHVYIVVNRRELEYPDSYQVFQTKNAASSVHYLEIVTPDVDAVCAFYSKTLNAVFSDPVPELGNARTASRVEGGLIGVRQPMHDQEEPTIRPYYLVDDIDAAIAQAESHAALIAVPPMEIPGYGRCAIVMIGAVQSGFWQLTPAIP